LIFLSSSFDQCTQTREKKTLREFYNREGTAEVNVGEARGDVAPHQPPLAKKKSREDRSGFSSRKIEKDKRGRRDTPKEETVGGIQSKEVVE